MGEASYREAEDSLWRSTGARPREQMLALARLDTSVRVLEIGQGPPVVFVHGASNGATSWAHLAARMPEFRCVLLDRPGCALSPPLRPPPADMEQFQAVAEALVVDVLDALELPGADVVATSFGGYFALRGAAAHPHRVRRLVLLGWTFGAPVAATPLVMRLAATPVAGRLGARIPPTDATVRALLRQVGLRGALASGRFGPTEIAWFKALLRHTNTMRNEMAGSPRVMTMRGFNEASRFPAAVLQQVTAPTLALWGSDDPMGGVRIAEDFCALLPDVQLEILDGAGHAPWMDYPDEVATRVVAFLSTDEPQPPQHNNTWMSDRLGPSASTARLHSSSSSETTLHGRPSASRTPGSTPLAAGADNQTVAPSSRAAATASRLSRFSCA